MVISADRARQISEGILTRWEAHKKNKNKQRAFLNCYSKNLYILETVIKEAAKGQRFSDEVNLYPEFDTWESSLSHPDLSWLTKEEQLAIYSEAIKALENLLKLQGYTLKTKKIPFVPFEGDNFYNGLVDVKYRFYLSW